MAQGAPTPQPPHYPVSLEGCAPFLLSSPLLQCSSIGSLLSGGRGCQVAQSRGVLLHLQIGGRQFRWRPHVSSASFCRRLLLTTYLQGPVTQRKASPGDDTPNQLGLFGVWCRSAGEERERGRWPVWQEEMQQLQLRCFSNQNF